MNKTFLSITRDIMSATMQLEVIHQLLSVGHRVYTFTEGLAVSVFEKAGIPIFYRGDGLLTPLGTDKVVAAIGEVKPNAILVGCDSPINWSREFAEVGKILGVPVAAFADTYGALFRLNGIVPDLAFVIDGGEARDMEARRFAKHCVVIGDTASTIDVKIPDDKLEELCKICKGKKSIMIVADSIYNAEEITAAVTQSIRKEEDPDRFVIFGSFVHPKQMKESNVVPVLDRVYKMLDGLDFVMHQHLGINTNQMAGYSDAVATTFSTPGRIALHNGKRFLSVFGPRSVELLKKECGSQTYPLAAQNVVPRLDGSMSLTNLLDAYGSKSRSKEWAMHARFRPENAYNAILELAK